jgi:hypothetical protein
MLFHLVGAEKLSAQRRLDAGIGLGPIVCATAHSRMLHRPARGLADQLHYSRILPEWHFNLAHRKREKR